MGKINPKKLAKKQAKYAYEPQKTNWLWEPFRIIMYNLVCLIEWLWYNFIWYPNGASGSSVGLLRILFYIYLIVADSFNVLYESSGYAAFICGFMYIEILVGFLQFFGFHSGNTDFTGENSRPIKYRTEIETEGMTDEEIMRRYPRIERWFEVREAHLASLSLKERAEFLRDTGGLTSIGIREMHKYPRTRRALERLNYELSGSNADMVKFMTGKK